MYTLNKLGPENFEHLIQSLCKKIIGEGVSIFGAGPDGQREATFNGKAPYPSEQNCWDGYWVVQAKYKNPNTKEADYLWLKKCFEEEMANFQAKKSEGKKLPDNYLFFTNIVLTPVSEKGIKDKIEEVAKNYISLIPNIHIIGSDDINRFLDGHRDVAVSYASYILSGDILSYLYGSIQEANRERQTAFHRYLYRSFINDYCSRMEQAGQLTEDKASIDKVYVDLNFRDEDTGVKGKFIEHAISNGNRVFRFSALDSKQKDANIVNKPLSSNKYVLKGSAGQGKSTVCQFLAQIYRASFIENFSNLCDDKIKDFLETIQSDSIKKPTCYRVPVRIELRLYSSWIANRQKDNKQYDLVTYISSIIGDVSSSKFDNETLRLYFNKYAWAFFFDGLDEVPESSNRKEVMLEIENFINVELKQADADAIFYATTRPEGYVGEFNNVNFNHLDLMTLSKESCFLYLKKLLSAIENDSVKRNEYLEILKQGWENKQIAFIMQTPLQATIITILVRSGGEPPRDKFSLFKEYFEIIIKREKQKGMGTILNENQDLIEGIYYLLGYELQKSSASIKGSDALISLAEMKKLIKIKLAQDGISEEDDAYQRLLDDAYSMVVNRINFASEVREGFIGFSIRSMQEFLAAVYIERNINDEKIGMLLKALAKSSYWRNTFIFIVECIAKEKTYYLDFLIDTLIGELNGKDLSIDELEALSSVHYGSQVAFDLLASNIFKNKRKYENKLCKYIVEYSELQYINNIAKVTEMSDNVKKELAKLIMSKGSLTKADSIMLALFLQDDNIVSIKEYCCKNAIKITKDFFDYFNNIFPKQIYDLVLISLQSGELLQLDLNQIIAFINNSSLNHADKIKQTLFKITIKALLERHNTKGTFMKPINEYFKGDLEDFSKCREWFSGEENKLTEGLSVLLSFPCLSKKDFSELISLADKYKCDSLVIVLNTIKSKDLDDYIKFSELSSNLINEIKLLNEDVVIRQNAILYQIWTSMLEGKKYSVEQIRQKLINVNPINSIKELLKDCELEPTAYSVSAEYSKSVFIDVYKITKEIYSVEEIKKFPAICELMEFLFYCQIACSHEELSHQEFAELIDKIFIYSEVDKKGTIWQKYIWELAFLKLSFSQMLKHGNIQFSTNKSQLIYGLLSFNEEEQVTVLNNILKYVSATDNLSALDFFFDFLLTINTFEVVPKIDFSLITDCKDNRISCLKEIKKSKDENDVINNLVPLLIEESSYDLVFQLVSKVNMPTYFLPVYLYFLKDLRNKDSVKNIYTMEKKIVEFITIPPVDNKLLDF